MSDETLMGRFQETAETRYFEELWRRHFRTVFGKCLQVLRNQSAAEDVASETFLTALNKAEEYREVNFGAWLRTIAKHLSINRLKSAFERLSHGPVDELAEAAAQGSDPELVAQVESVLNQLSGEQRITLKLLYIDGYSYEEVARVQGWSVKQVKNYAQNGRRMFVLLWERKTDARRRKAGA